MLSRNLLGFLSCSEGCSRFVQYLYVGSVGVAEEPIKQGQGAS